MAALGVAAWATLAEETSARLWADCALGWTLLALAWIDWETMRLPDALTLPLVVAGLAATLILMPDLLLGHVAAAAGGFLLLRGLGALYRARRGSEGIGRGDAKLLAAAGAWIGLAGLPWVLLGASAGGLVLAGFHAVRGRRMTRSTAIPFGPSLCLAFWVVWLYGPPPLALFP